MVMKLSDLEKVQKASNELRALRNQQQAFLKEDANRFEVHSRDPAGNYNGSVTVPAGHPILRQLRELTVIFLDQQIAAKVDQLAGLGVEDA